MSNYANLNQHEADLLGRAAEILIDPADVQFRGDARTLPRALLECGMRGWTLADDAEKIQRFLDREARRSETMRILNVNRGGIA